MTLKDVKILFVDDDPNILSGFERIFRKHFTVCTAPDAENAYKLITGGEGPFAIVVSDMHMPGIDGVQFLSKIREMTPDTIRIMLTGLSDIEIAINAINEGSIFRFLTKPCPPDTMMKALLMGLQQYNLVTAEKVLLENTLKGSIQVLTDILAMTNPCAFSRAKRLRYFITEMGKKLEIDDLWQYEVAAMLSQIGCVTVPIEIVEKNFEGVELDPTETHMIKEVPETGRRLLEKIPRLEVVSAIIEKQSGEPDFTKIRYPLKNTDPVVLGMMMLKAATDFDTQLCHKASKSKAIEMMQISGEKYEPHILELLRGIEIPELENASTKLLKIETLEEGMVLAEDIKTEKGFLVVSKGYETTDILIRRLSNYCKQKIIKDSVRVYLQES